MHTDDAISTLLMYAHTFLFPISAKAWTLSSSFKYTASSRFGSCISSEMWSLSAFSISTDIIAAALLFMLIILPSESRITSPSTIFSKIRAIFSLSILSLPIYLSSLRLSPEIVSAIGTSSSYLAETLPSLSEKLMLLRGSTSFFENHADNKYDTKPITASITIRWEQVFAKSVNIVFISLLKR